MDSARHLLGTQDFRCLSAAEQAIKLIQEKHCGVREALRVTCVSAASYYRAKQALQEGRSIGVHGRPTILGDEGEALLVNALDEARDKQQPLSYAETRVKVFLPPRHANHTFIRFSLQKPIIKLTNKAQDIFKNLPNKNLANGVPKFSNGFMKRFKEEYEFKTRVTRPIDQVCIHLHIPNTIKQYFNIIVMCFRLGY